MFCHKCGAKNVDDAGFCSSCGARLTSTMVKVTEPENENKMSEKERADLLTYMGKEIELECTKIILEKSVEQYKENLNKRKPKLEYKELPIKPDNNAWYAVRIGGILILGMLLLLGSCVTCMEGCSFDWIKEGFEEGIFFVILSIIINVLVVVGLVERAKYSDELTAYKRDYPIAVKENERIKQKYDEDTIKWKEEERKVLPVMMNALKNLTVLMKEHKKNSPVFEKYLTLPALCTMREYFTTGRCSGLTGPNGAYNLYEEEVRSNMIITKLSEIGEHLDDIKGTQYGLYLSLKDIEKQQKKISDEIMHITGYVGDIRSLAAMNTLCSGISVAK